MNAVNGGSFAVTAAKRTSPIALNDRGDRLAARAGRAHGAQHAAALPRVRGARFPPSRRPARLFAGAGCTTARRCSATAPRPRATCCCSSAAITDKELPAIAEVNPDKFGCVHARHGHSRSSPRPMRAAMKPDYFLVLPWHFKEGILRARAGIYGAGRQADLPVPGNRDCLSAFSFPAHFERGTD